MYSAPTIAALIIGAVFFSPNAAYADDTPTPEPTPVVLEPWTADDESAPYLDCDAGAWLVDRTHYYAEQTEPGVWADPTVTVETGVFVGWATGDGPESDCPNWVIVGEDDPVWVNTSEKFPPALPLDPLPTVETPAPEHHGKAGIVSPPKRGLSLTS